MSQSQLPEAYLAEEFHWWRRALSRDRLPTRDWAMECGLYRFGKRRVAIWLDGVLKDKRVQYDGVDQWMENAKDDWVKYCSNPISPQLFFEVAKTGVWPNAHAEADAVVKDMMTAIGLRIGDNNPPDEGSVDELSARLDEMAREAERMIAAGAAKTQDDADRCAKVADALSAIQKAVVDQHKRRKEPHLEAGRTIDRVWFPLRDRAEDWKRKLKAVVLTPFLLVREAQLQQENAALIAQGAVPENIASPTAKAVGSTRTSALRTKVSAEITDYNALWTSQQTHPEVVALITEIANRSARAGITLPGMTIKRERGAV